ncbi:hypothetical protein MHPYR_80160 [uncultured Mycobacterium sp.]|uniref:Uncharacterized protein n=1 Tax=uncultured Mycobacterium sp. TaxID=171292 RepID=A0A1Y5PTN9_9MYCO|nr:hypothetical protein MHPYR_80160 [uncultured Mycobacterium sp.]
MYAGSVRAAWPPTATGYGSSRSIVKSSLGIAARFLGVKAADNVTPPVVHFAGRHAARLSYLARFANYLDLWPARTASKKTRT